MQKFNIVLADDSQLSKELLKQLEGIGINFFKCGSDPFEIQKFVFKKSPITVVIGSSCEMLNNSVEAVLREGCEPLVIIIAEKFEKLSLPESKNILVIRSVEDVSFAKEKIRFKALEAYKNSLIRSNNSDVTTSKFIKQALSELCLTANLNGSRYVEAILYGLFKNELSIQDSMTKVIYPYAGKIFKTTGSCVERCIRTAVVKCWKKCDGSELLKYFGFSFVMSDDPPTNREFIAMIYASIKIKLEDLEFNYGEILENV